MSSIFFFFLRSQAIKSIINLNPDTQSLYRVLSQYLPYYKNFGRLVKLGFLFIIWEEDIKVLSKTQTQLVVLLVSTV